MAVFRPKKREHLLKKDEKDGLVLFFVLDGTLVLCGFFSMTLKEICDSLSMTNPALLVVTAQNSRDHFLCNAWQHVEQRKHSCKATRRRRIAIQFRISLSLSSLLAEVPD
jgi:hypothetical protein